MLAKMTLVLAMTGLLFSCKKDNDGEDNSEDIAKADNFKAFILSKQFQIKAYYSDKPIDYNEEDEEVKAETELFHYVSPWIKDDYNIFDIGTGKVTIIQNAVKVPGNDAEELIRDFSVAPEKNGPRFNFLNYLYDPLQYKVVEFADNYFVISADWHSGAKVFTRFEVVD